MIKLILKLPLIYPANNFKLAWDIVNLIMISILLFIIPVYISAQISIIEVCNIKFLFSCSFFFIADTYINLNTGYYDKGNYLSYHLFNIDYII